MKRPLASFSGLPWASSLAAYWIMVRTVPLRQRLALLGGVEGFALV